MKSANLEEDLSNCLINFDRRVLITELLEDYELSYREVNKIVQNFLVEQEKKFKQKFEKRYLVHGKCEDDGIQKEVYQIVEEAKLKEWLNKLQNSESTLYSVEVAGGAKAAAPLFKPMRILECAHSKTRKFTKTCVNDEPIKSSAVVGKTPVKEEKNTDIYKQQLPKTSKKETSAEKTSPKGETTPPEQKSGSKKPSKKGINNFFAPSTSTKKPDDAKPKTEVSKPSTPKKMIDFFKKQTEKPASCTEELKQTGHNISLQLFDDNEEEPEDVESSDEEEKLEALKRDIISSDVEIEDEENEKQPAKRRRILDSDDEEDPPKKQEKLDTKEETKDDEAAAETYLDEEGFVITKKPKQKATSSSKPTTTKKIPPVNIKTSPKAAKNSNANKQTKATANPTTKTKQVGIMNFFSKK